MNPPQGAVPGRLRKMRLAELGRLAELIEIAFAEDQEREGSSFRGEVQNLRRLLPLLRLVAALRPDLEDQFYTLVWDTGEAFPAAVTIGQQGGDRRHWYIANVATHPDHRGRGLARLLVGAALDHIRARGGRHVLLEVRGDNEPAYRLYQSMGFRLLKTSTLLKGEARSIAPSARPAGCELRALPAADWRTRLIVAERLASPEVRAVCPPTAEQFQSGAVARGVQSLVFRAQRMRRQVWAVEEAARPVGLVDCQIRRSGVQPHYVQIGLAPERLDPGNVAPWAIGHAVRSCGEVRSGPMLLELAGQPQAPIDFLRSIGFAPIETMHQLVRSVDPTVP